MGGKPLVAKGFSLGSHPFGKSLGKPHWTRWSAWTSEHSIAGRPAAAFGHAVDSGDCRRASHGSRQPTRLSRMERFNDAGAVRTGSCIARVPAHKLACSTSRVIRGTCKTNVCLVMTI